MLCHTLLHYGLQIKIFLSVFLIKYQPIHKILIFIYQAYTSEADLFLDQLRKTVDPCVLLNMRQLKRLEIFDKRKNQEMIIRKEIIGPTKLNEQSNVTFENFKFINLTGSII